MTPRLSLVQHLGLYKAFHQSPTNRAIHNIGTPLVMFTGLVLTAFVAPAPGAIFHLGTVASVLLTLAFLQLDVVGAVVFGAGLLAMAALASAMVGAWAGWPLALGAVGAHALAWFLLVVIGHGQKDEAPVQTPRGEKDTHEYFRRRLFLGRNTGVRTSWLDSLLQFSVAPFAVVFELFEALGARPELSAAVDDEAKRVLSRLARDEALFSSPPELEITPATSPVHAEQPRVWLASLRCGNGHLALRDSLARSVENQVPVSLLTSSTLALEATHHRLVQLGDTTLRAAWSAADLPGLSLVLPLTYPELYVDAERWLRATRGSDVVVSTHFAQALALTQVRNRLGLPTRIVHAIPDYTTPPNSFCPTSERLRADAYVVMSSGVRRWLIDRRGVAPQRVHHAGFQAAPCFEQAREADRASAWELVRGVPGAERLREDQPTILFLGGSGWTRRTEPVLRALLEDPRARLNFVIVAGRDARFARRAREVTQSAAALVTDFIPQPVLAALMRVAAVPVLGSAAPAMLQELLAVGCGPWALFRHLGGSEDGHPAWVREHRFGVVERDAATMARRVLELADAVEATPDTVALRAEFPRRAAGERSTQAERSAELAAFLASVLPPPRLTAGQRASERTQLAPS